MSRRSRFLFITMLMLFILTQVLVLGWRPQAVFFVTWLFLALTVRHDGRLSVVAGLAFLATCPFLLLGKQEAAAELAANYAYFFLAIGVLVQLEEMILERYGWLERKLDPSLLWKPVIQAYRWLQRAAARALRPVLSRMDQASWVRMIQVAGFVGLAAASLTAALFGAWAWVVLTLLGAAILFPLVVWGLQLVSRAAGSVWVLRLVLVLIVLPLAVAGMIWLQPMVASDRMARMKVAYDFVAYLPQADVRSSDPQFVRNDYFTIDGQERRVLFMHPDSRARYTIPVPEDGLLAFDLATSPESWDQPGDGVAFAVYVDSDQGMEQVFSTYIDPKQNQADRRWHPHTVDLGGYAGQTITLTLETTSGPAGDNRFDWAGWGTPRVMRFKEGLGGD